MPKTKQGSGGPPNSSGGGRGQMKWGSGNGSGLYQNSEGVANNAHGIQSHAVVLTPEAARERGNLGMPNDKQQMPFTQQTPGHHTMQNNGPPGLGVNKMPHGQPKPPALNPDHQSGKPPGAPTGSLPLQFGTITPNFLPAFGQGSQQQQQQPGLQGHPSMQPRGPMQQVPPQMPSPQNMDGGVPHGWQGRDMRTGLVKEMAAFAGGEGVPPPPAGMPPMPNAAGGSIPMYGMNFIPGDMPMFPGRAPFHIPGMPPGAAPIPHVMPDRTSPMPPMPQGRGMTPPVRKVPRVPQILGQRPKSKAIAIIDPDTHTEVQISSPKVDKDKVVTEEKASADVKASVGETDVQDAAAEPKENAAEKKTPVVMEKRLSTPIAIKDVDEVASPEAQATEPVEASSEAKEDKPQVDQTVKEPVAPSQTEDVKKPVPVEKSMDAEEAPSTQGAKVTVEEANEGGEEAKAKVADELPGPPYRYTFDYLLTFKEKCTTKPKGLENSDITNLQGSGPTFGGKTDRGPPGSPRVSRQASGDQDKWMKNAGKSGLQGLQGLMPGNRSSRGGQSGPPGAMGRNSSYRSNDGGRWGKTSFPAQHRPEVNLHKAENKYQVGQIKSEDPEEEKRQKEIKAVLNKLTPQNFDKLVLQLGDIKVGHEQTLVGLIDQIFDKSISEPTFCELYAQLCQSLRDRMPEFERDDIKINFRRVLLNKCQEEFEKGDEAIKEAREQLEKISQSKIEDLEEGEIKDPKAFKQEKEKKILACKDMELKAKRRMLGNVTFIGQLYKKNMLTEKIMHQCIVEQLGEIENPDAESVEALCKLMTTIGFKIDQPKSKPMMDEYFNRLDILSKNPQLDSRIKFMIQDVIDLRFNSWRLRRKVEGPKLLSEVHKDAMASIAGSKSRDRDRRDRMNPNFRGGDYRGGDYRGGGYGNRGQGMSHFENEGFVEYSKRPHSGLSGRPNIPTRLAPQATFLQPGLRRDSSRKESPRASDEPSGKLGDPKFIKSRVSKPVEKEVLSKEDTEKKAKAIIEEFYSVEDKKEVLTCLKELREKQADLGVVLQTWLCDVIEGRNRDVGKLSALLLSLAEAKPQVLKAEDWNAGTLNILCTLEDLAIDAPKAPQILAFVISELIHCKLVSISILGNSLTDAFEKYVGEKAVVFEIEDFLNFLLLLMKNLLEKKWLMKNLESEISGALGSMPKFDMAAIEKYGMQTYFRNQMYKSHLTTALQNGADPAYLSNWLDVHVDPDARGDPQLASSAIVGSLGLALSGECSTSMDDELRVVTDRDHGLAKLYRKLIKEGDLNAELNSVFALQQVNHDLKSPKGLMTRLLKDFYYSGVLSEEAFTKWRDDNKDKSPGKVKAICDATAWLNWLAEQGDQEESED